MGKLHSKVIRVLRDQLTNVRDLLDDLPEGRVSGIVVSSDFDRLDHGARQQRVEKILRHKLTDEEFRLVGAIALLTPAEINVKAVPQESER